MGPVMVAMPLTLPIMEKCRARRCRGTLSDRSSKAPGDIPPDPMPAIALPTIRPFEVGVEAHTKDPTSNKAKAIRYVHLVEKKVYTLPKGSVTAQVVKRYALAYQDRSSRELNSSVILGVAVERIVLSYESRYLVSFFPIPT